MSENSKAKVKGEKKSFIPVDKIRGMKNITRKNPLPLNFAFNKIAINKATKI